MRLFVALEIPAAVRDSLAALMEELRAADSVPSKKRARWVRAENLHVTLKFIGDIDDAKLDDIRTVLSKVRSDAAADVDFRGLGFFPSDQRPRVFWADMKASPNLAALAGDIDKQLEPLGVPRETREFTPHLTLARFDPPGISERLRAATNNNAARGFGTLHTSEFHLIESKLHRSGAEYTTLQSFRFAAEA